MMKSQQRLYFQKITLKKNLQKKNEYTSLNLGSADCMFSGAQHYMSQLLMSNSFDRTQTKFSSIGKLSYYHGKQEFCLQIVAGSNFTTNFHILGGANKCNQHLCYRIILVGPGAYWGIFQMLIYAAIPITFHFRTNKQAFLSLTYGFQLLLLTCFVYSEKF